MAYNQSGHSELERRFEALFSQVFHCSWQDYLTAQYPIQGADGKNYFIDYVYPSGTEKIGIELDGRGKFYQYKHVFNNFFQRQNAIQLAGITVYRFTWMDVVEEGGWRARKQLHQIFKDKLPVVINTPVPAQEEPSGSKLIEYQPSFSQQAPIEKGWRPAIRVMGVLVGGLLAASLILIGIVGLNGIHAPEAQEETKIVHPVSDVTPAPKAAIRTTQTPQKKPQPHTQPQKMAVNANRVSVPSVGTPLQASKPKTPTPILRTEALPPALTRSIKQERLNPPVTAPDNTVVEASPTESATVPDEIVAFNQESGVFHKPNSYWARKCTRNCIYIPKSQAIQKGGRPSRSD